MKRGACNTSSTCWRSAGSNARAGVTRSATTPAVLAGRGCQREYVAVGSSSAAQSAPTPQRAPWVAMVSITMLRAARRSLGARGPAAAGVFLKLDDELQALGPCGRARELPLECRNLRDVRIHRRRLRAAPLGKPRQLAASGSGAPGGEV